MIATRVRSRILHAAVTIAVLLATQTAGAIGMINGLGGVAGFGEGILPTNDDGSSAAIDVSAAFPSGLRFFGMTFRSVFVNNNGNITFGGGLSAYTPNPFPTASQRMIAPWWGDVDTRGGGRPTSNGVYWDITPGQFVATWHRVGYYAQHDNLQNSFQLILRAAPGGCVGDFTVEFRYARCEWTTGDASGGTNGRGGTEAQAGFDAGDRVNYYTLPGSRTAAVLELCTRTNAGTPGLWRFNIRGGELPCDGGGGACMTGRPGVCATGTTQCRANVPTCVAEIMASPERCDGLDNDCNGMADDGAALCPAGQVCDRASCVPNCVEGGCFDGQTCSDRGTCVESACAAVVCPAGQRCEGGRCMAACDGISCPAPTVCRAGRCVDACLGVTCDTGNVCVDGVCRGSCPCRACPTAQTCRMDGRCLPTACATVSCAAGTVCNAGMCVDPCIGAVCPRGQMCSRGACITPEVPDAGTERDASLPDVGAPVDSGEVIADAGADAGDANPRADSARADGNGRDGSTTDTRMAGCGCRTAGRANGGMHASALLIVAVALLGRRRRSCSRERNGCA